MDASVQTITIGPDLEKELPGEVDFIGEDGLSNVPFSMLMLGWKNPRRLGEVEGTTMGRGFDPNDMQELYNGIKDLGQLLPYVTRWVLHPDGSLKTQVGDGERRYRCTKRMLEKNESVWSQKEHKMLPAKEVYEKVLCRIVIGKSEEWPLDESNGCRYSCTDDEMLEVAFKLTANAVGWGEGANAKLIKELRLRGYDDKKILDQTGKSSQWLREMDDICKLDDLTFTYLTDDRINRALALRLAKIEDIDRRQRYLHAAYEDAVVNHQQDLAVADEDLEKAEQREETAEAELVEAQELGDTEAEEVAAEKLEKAQIRTQTKRRQRQEVAKPKGKMKNLRNAAVKVAEEDAEENPADIPSDVAQALRPGKIRSQQEIIEKLIKDNGKDEDGKELFSIATLSVLLACYKAIIAGEEDILKILRRQRNVLKIQSLRNNQPPPDVAADMEADETEDEDDPLEKELREDDDEDE